MVEKRATHGGTCLNIGCIPSKALLHASELFNEAGHAFARMGIGVRRRSSTCRRMMKFKQEGDRRQRQGRRLPVQEEQDRRRSRHRPHRRAGQGRGERRRTARRQTLETKNIVIATGSDVARLKGIEIDEKRIVSSTGALSLDKVPEQLLVIGAGVIGLELGSVWRRLGAEVTVVEFLDRILPGMDGEVRQPVPAHAREAGHDVQARRPRSPAVDTVGTTLKVKVEPAKGGAAETLDADVVLVAVGRVPYTEGLGLERGRRRARRARPRHGRRHFATNVDGIYAIGDVIARPDAGAQGRGRRHRRRRNPRRPGRPRELRRDPERRLHHAGDRLGRQNRRRAEGAASPTRSASSRSPPTAAPRPTRRPTASSRSWPTPRPTACSACTSSAPTPAT